MSKSTLTGARSALFLLLAINLFNYIDRQVLAALEPDIRATFFPAGGVNAMTKTGLLGDAFFVTYMISAPILGLLADRFSRWIIIGSAVLLWSLASGGSGLAATFTIFAIICIGGIVFTLTHVPETTGHSLEAIEAYLESGQPLVALGAAKT